jgi:hypothetical protein
MRIVASFACFLALSTAAACSQGHDPMDQAQEDALRVEVEETLAGLTQAMNAHDSDAVLGYFRESDEFLYLGCTEIVVGWDAFARRAAMYYVASPEVVFEQEVVRVQVLSPTVAVAAIRGGSTEVEDLFWTEVLVKEGGKWVIAHEHESWPGCSPPSAPHPFTSMDDSSGMVGMDSLMIDLDSIGPGGETSG